MTSTRIRELSADWNAVDGELDQLWRDNPDSHGRKAWGALARPLWARQSEIETELGSLLLEWAEANDLGHYRPHYGFLTGNPPGWIAQPKSYPQPGSTQASR